MHQFNQIYNKNKVRSKLTFCAISYIKEIDLLALIFYSLLMYEFYTKQTQFSYFIFNEINKILESYVYLDTKIL